jgi:hypothetical protein
MPRSCSHCFAVTDAVTVQTPMISKPAGTIQAAA